jgi:molybdopterin converting factor small subunit
MLRVNIKAFGLLKEVIRDTYFEMDRGNSLEDLLLQMVENYGGDFTKQIFDPKKKIIQKGVGISVNGQFINGDVSATKLKDSDRVAFFILVSGG